MKCCVIFIKEIGHSSWSLFKVKFLISFFRFLKMFLIILEAILLLNIVTGQQMSPCPKVLTYEPRNFEDDRWYGVLTFKSEEDLTGIYINIVLDRPAQLLGVWLILFISITKKYIFLSKNNKFEMKIWK